jgi:hypothetical protein
MKYLKLFENHNEYYVSVKSSEFNVGSSQFNAEFTESEIHYICRENNLDFDSVQWFKNEKNRITIYDPIWWNGLSEKERREKLRGDSSPEFWMFVFKATDEWYYVSVYANRPDDLLYKCDQLEGLSKLIEHEKKQLT